MDQYIFFMVNEEPLIQGDKVCLQNTTNGSMEMVKLDQDMMELVKSTFPGFNFQENRAPIPDNSQNEVSKLVNNGGKWSHEHILRLINLRKEKNDLFNSTTLRNEEVWEKIATEMPGFNKSQVKDKWQYLRKKYIKKKDNMSIKASGAELFKFEYFNEIDEILGKKPNIVPKHVASSLKGANVDSVNHNNDALEDGEPIPKKKKENSQDNALLKYLKEEATNREEARKKRHQELIDVKNRSIEVFSEKMDKLIEKL